MHDRALRSLVAELVDECRKGVVTFISLEPCFILGRYLKNLEPGGKDLVTPVLLGAVLANDGLFFMTETRHIRSRFVLLLCSLTERGRWNRCPSTATAPQMRGSRAGSSLPITDGDSDSIAGTQLPSEPHLWIPKVSCSRSPRRHTLGTSRSGSATDLRQQLPTLRQPQQCPCSPSSYRIPSIAHTRQLQGPATRYCLVPCLYAVAPSSDAHSCQYHTLCKAGLGALTQLEFTQCF